MKIALAVLITFSLAAVLGASALRPDPSWYVRKSAWQDTLLSAKSKRPAHLTAKPTSTLPDGVKLGKWKMAGPLVPTDGRGFSTAFWPEKQADGDGNGHSWVAVDYPDGIVNNFDVPTNGSVYLSRTVASDVARPLTVYLGSDDGIAVWLNGVLIHSNDIPRVTAPDQDVVKINLRKGENTLLLKIYNIMGGCGFYFSTAPNPAVVATGSNQSDPDQPIWDLLQRDFTDDESRIEMKWERDDGIWRTDGKPVSYAVLAQRYAVSTVGWEADTAKRFAAGASTAEDVAKLRSIYYNGKRSDAQISEAAGFSFEALRLAVTDLSATYGSEYPNGPSYLAQLKSLQQSILEARKNGGSAQTLIDELKSLRRQALLSNPLLKFDKMLFVKRSEKQLGLPQNWQGNASIPTFGYDNEIDTLSISTGATATLYRPGNGAFVGDIEPNFDGDRFLLSKPGTQNRFQIFEMKMDGSGLRQVTPGDQPDVDNYSGAYLPDGRIVFCSTACYRGVPCVGGSDSVGSLYLLNESDKSIRQLTFDQDQCWYPRILNSGQVLYTRWEYSDTPHYFSRLLFRMNPDGTNQFEHYGSNSYWPNGIFYARPVPNDPSKLVGIVSGHHGVARMGELVLFDPENGRQEASGAVQMIPFRGKAVKPIIADQLVASASPKFLHPFPLSDKYFLVSCQPDGHPWGIYLVDAFDNMVCLAETPGYALFEPVPIQKREKPPVIPDRVKLTEKTGTVFMQDVYRGPGLKGVPHGTVKALRVYSNQYSYRGMGGHISVGIDGPWDAKRILGTVPVNRDGSAFFAVPANTPIVVQPLDAEGKALQVMRSWYTAMPGEHASCVGCHEPQNSSPGVLRVAGARTRLADIKPWYGPARPFSFEREVQKPVLQTYCVGCHNGTVKSRPDFRAREERPGYHGSFTPAYEALHRYVRRPGNESDYHLPVAAEWDANTSELVQMLKKGHHGVRLDAEAWDRLYTWIDLNVPCHGTWSEQNGSAPHQNERMMQLWKLYGGPDINPELYPEMPIRSTAQENVQMVKTVRKHVVLSAKASVRHLSKISHALLKRGATPGSTRLIELDGGIALRLVNIPAGEFMMGSRDGQDDEKPKSRVVIERSYWMSDTEVTNELYALFDASHDNGVISMHNKDHDTRGYPISEPRQPVVRVSWREAMAFCKWLSAKTGEVFTLPTEAQWEYACRAGTETPFSFGDLNTAFSTYANLGDFSLRALAVAGLPPRPSVNPDPLLDWIPKETRFDDKSVLPSIVASYKANPFGLYDMHGNVAEWTRSTYAPYPYHEEAGDRKVVRGGSWFDRPHRCTSSYRLSYPSWQKVYNVGFRVISLGHLKSK